MIEWRTERKFLERVFRTLHVEGATNHGSTLDGYLVMKWDSSERTFEWAGTWLVRPVHKEGIEELKGARWNAVHWKFCFLTCLIGARLDLLLIVVLQWFLFHSFIVCMPRVHCMLYYLISLCFMRIAALIIWNLSHEVFSGIEDIYILFSLTWMSCSEFLRFIDPQGLHVMPRQTSHLFLNANLLWGSISHKGDCANKFACSLGQCEGR